MLSPAVFSNKTKEQECACYATIMRRQAYKNFQCHFNEDDKKKKQTVGPYFQCLFVAWLSYSGRLVKVMFTSAHSMHTVYVHPWPHENLLLMSTTTAEKKVVACKYQSTEMSCALNARLCLLIVKFCRALFSQFHRFRFRRFACAHGKLLVHLWYLFVSCSSYRMLVVCLWYVRNAIKVWTQ